MKKIIGLAIPLLIASASVAFAQSATPGNEPAGKSPAVGAKESYGAGAGNQTGPGTGGTGAPGVTGSGASVGDKAGYATQDPSRTGASARTSSPATAGPKGDSTNTGQ